MEFSTKDIENPAKIVELRKARKMNQEELAKELGVDRQTVIRIEKGRSTLTTYLTRLCSIFGVRSAVFFTDNMDKGHFPALTEHTGGDYEANTPDPDEALNYALEKSAKLLEGSKRTVTEIERHRLIKDIKDAAMAEYRQYKDYHIGDKALQELLNNLSKAD